VVLESNVTDGKLVVYKLTSNYTFQDSGGTSVFAGSLFGFNTGDSTTSTVKVPFFLYAGATASDTDLIFVASRQPAYFKFVSTQFFDAASGGADLSKDFIALEVLGGSKTSYDGSRCDLVGSFMMQINGSDDWTVTNVNEYVGFNRFTEAENTVFGKGIFGAASNSFF
jgi:hypothetical protein